MPPTFMADSFRFTDGQEVPDHVEARPDEETRDTTKIWLEGHNTIVNEFYPLAVDIDIGDLPTAEILRQARINRLEETKQSASNAGQKRPGVLDNVYVRVPYPVKSDAKGS